MEEKRTIDIATAKMLEKAKKDNVETAWDRAEKMRPQCGFGETGVCCRICNMGPCRIDLVGDGPKKGICGADADVIVARNLIRMIAAGAAAHSDHGRDIAHTLHMAAEGSDYDVKEPEKLKEIAKYFGVKTEGKDIKEIAKKVAEKALEDFGRYKGLVAYPKRAVEQRQKIWKENNVWPRSIDREIVQIMHQTHMGVDADYINLIQQGVRAALGDGWGGSMIATDISDVLFGVPKPIETEVNLGVLEKDMVNIVVHGHEPTLSDMIVQASQDKELLEKAKEVGAKGINLVGMCCTGNEVVMRHGTKMVGNFLQQEAAIVTGAVDAMIVDVQCIMPSLSYVASCYHTKLITTSPKAKVPGAIHIEFDEEHAYEIAKKIIMVGIENYKNRIPEKVNIPEEKSKAVVGFSVETILNALGGSVKPLVDAIVAGDIKGAAGLVGCNNPKTKHNYYHVELAKELIKNDVLVVLTGCAAYACGAEGLLTLEAKELCGPGLKKVCELLKIPPVLHMGSCVDCSRILILLNELAKYLKTDISDLPVAGAAPEWMSEKAVSIGTYFVASGVYTILGVCPPVLGSKNVTKLLTEDVEKIYGGKFAVETDPHKAAQLIMDHIETKRKALGV
ncbi:carbon-monoxide dehydrogenase catalytic subunit acsA [Thermoanaerobacter kivui]|uniref:anaerobic carbon-monoxide dehydrogenase n=1 Tax=Thermoanaerobacter kivui TaxID=2325 RepID=A0A097ATM9_THEKI|nr:anaerobic carbon-monoxide dehydrogenase catalytic subunit [Thermoanaerobacter kivui]AIS53154.1 carbon-monoxide dehydrogenase catalytic subunit acsA [Thermoanaerobacter kivui]